MVANASRRHIRKVFNRVRYGIRRKGAKKTVTKIKRCRTSIKALLKKLIRETIAKADRMDDYDTAMSRQRTVWRQQSGAGMIQDKNTYGNAGQQTDENAIPASASIIQRFFKLPGAKRTLATELFSRLLTDLENEQNEQ